MPKKQKLDSVYFIGIKGIAMTAMAKMAKELGLAVEGSDVVETFPTDDILRRLGVVVHEGFSEKNLKGKKPDRVVISAAFGVNNPEYKFAKKSRLNLVTQSEMLAELMSDFEGVGVAGIQGKTTTSSVLAYIMTEAGLSPSYMIGAPTVPDLGGSGHIGRGKYFIVEADEYRKSELDLTPKFLDLPLKHLIITSIELDHPDVYESAEEVYEQFFKLATKLPRSGTVVACADYPLVRRLVTRLVDRRCLTYGFTNHARYRIVDFSQKELASFSIESDKGRWGPFETQLIGRHNALNITAALIMAGELGVSQSVVRKAIRQFSGAARRFQFLGEYEGAMIYDDYAHHPTAIKYLVEAVRLRFPTKRLILVFQPHTYSRTTKFMSEFAASLATADKVVLLDVFASAREIGTTGIIKDLLSETRRFQPEAEHRSSYQEVAAYLKGTVTAGDVVLLVGAGNVYKVYNYLIAG